MCACLPILDDGFDGVTGLINCCTRLNSLSVIPAEGSSFFFDDFTGLARASNITGLSVGILFETVSCGSNGGEGEGGTYRNKAK